MHYKNRIPFLSLENYEINEEVASIISEETCRRFKVIGIDRFEGKGKLKILTIGMVNPTDEQAKNILEGTTGYKIRPFKIEEKALVIKLNELFVKRINN